MAVPAALNKPARAHPAFPPELQPRDRTRAASAEQVAALAAKLDPRLLGETPTPGEGAPIVGHDGVVESGNGRTLALRRAYGQGMESAKRYRRYLADQGFAVEGMTAPVLVRRRTTQLTPDARVRFTRQANEATVARMGAAEQAAGDAERLAPDVLDLVRAPDLQAAANRPFVRAFIDALPASERAGLMAADGSLARAGAARIEAALLARAYGDADLTARLVESADDELGPLGKALADAAPGVARLKAGIEAGSTAAEGDPVPGLLESVRAVVQAREAKQPLDFPLMQEDMLGGGLGAEGRAWLGAMLHRTKSGVRLKGRQRLAELLDGVVGEAGKRAPGADMFGAAPAKAGAILDAVTARQGQALRRETLFQGKKPVAVLKGDELGVDLADPKVARDAADDYYDRHLLNQKAKHPTLGEVTFHSSGRDKVRASSANLEKLRFLPALPQIIEQGRYLGSATPHPGSDPIIKAYHYLEAEVEIDGRVRGVKVTVREHAKTGKLFYNLNDDTQRSFGGAGSTRRHDGRPHPDTLNQPSASADGINLHLLDGAPGDAPRGAITIHEDGRAVIELFETADASTVVHETAHLFTMVMQDLAPHDAGIAADLGTFKRWTGAGDGPLLPAHHEKIATAFEAWIEGAAAPSGLEAAFRTLATFMARLFDGFRAQGRRATPEVEAVFERMLETLLLYRDGGGDDSGGEGGLQPSPPYAPPSQDIGKTEGAGPPDAEVEAPRDDDKPEEKRGAHEDDGPERLWQEEPGLRDALGKPADRPRSRPLSKLALTLRPQDDRVARLAEDRSGYRTVNAALAMGPTALRTERLPREGERRSLPDPADGEIPLSRGGRGKSGRATPGRSGVKTGGRVTRDGTRRPTDPMSRSGGKRRAGRLRLAGGLRPRAAASTRFALISAPGDTFAPPGAGRAQPTRRPAPPFLRPWKRERAARGRGRTPRETRSRRPAWLGRPGAP